MTLMGPTVADTVVQVEPRSFMHRPGGRGIISGIICLAIVVYLLYLATRLVRAIEKLADKP